MGGNLKKNVTFGTKRFVRYSWHVHYLWYPLIRGVTVVLTFLAKLDQAKLICYSRKSFLRYWTFKESCNLISREHLGQSFKNQNFAEPDMEFGIGSQVIIISRKALIWDSFCRKVDKNKFSAEISIYQSLYVQIT